jgi:hypothetical protein
MIDSWWSAAATIIAAIIGLAAVYLNRRQKELLDDCRAAVKDLQRFRALEDRWAEELALIKPNTTPEKERRQLRGSLNDKIGIYGQPLEIRKLLDRLGK